MVDGREKERSHVRKKEDVRKKEKEKKERNEGGKRKKEMADGLDGARALASFSSLPLALGHFHLSIHPSILMTSSISGFDSRIFHPRE